MPAKKKVTKKIPKKLNFLSFQDIIMNLQKFWGKNGCVILQPYSIFGCVLIFALTFDTIPCLCKNNATSWQSNDIDFDTDISAVYDNFDFFIWIIVKIYLNYYYYYYYYYY